MCYLKHIDLKIEFMKWALVTGAAKGIGRAISIHLAETGFNIIAHFNSSSEEASSLKEEIENLGKKCMLWQKNLSDLSTAFFLAQIPSLIVHNAAVFMNDNIVNFSKEDFQQHFNTNFLSPIILNNLMLKKNTEGDIIHILDYITFKLPSNFFSYSWSKKLLKYYTQLSAKSLAPNIKVNAISLGHITKNSRITEESFKKMKANTPLKLNSNIDEILTTIDFILKIKSLTGQIISLDGGSHLSSENYP